MDNEKSIGHVTIELVNTSQHDKPHKWGQIISDGRHVLVGMYEDGNVARQLFYMNKANVKTTCKRFNYAFRNTNR